MLPFSPGVQTIGPGSQERQTSIPCVGSIQTGVGVEMHSWPGTADRALAQDLGVDQASLVPGYVTLGKSLSLPLAKVIRGGFLSKAPGSLFCTAPGLSKATVKEADGKDLRGRGATLHQATVVVRHTTALPNEPSRTQLGEAGPRLTVWVSRAAFLPPGRLLRGSASCFLLKSLGKSHLVHFLPPLHQTIQHQKRLSCSDGEG